VEAKKDEMTDIYEKKDETVEAENKDNEMKDIAATSADITTENKQEGEQKEEKMEDPIVEEPKPKTSVELLTELLD
jgi:hypothetical protein